MRLRGTYLLLATAASVGAMLVLAGPAAAANLHCGEEITSSVTLIGNLDCSGTGATALWIGADAVTLNLNGFTVKGAPGEDVIANYAKGSTGGHGTTADTPANGTTIKNGGLVFTSDGIGVDNEYGGSNLALDVVNIVGDGTNTGSVGVYDGGSAGLSVVDGSISGVRNGVMLDGSTGALVKGNVIMPSNATFGHCAGVWEDSGTINYIAGNAFSAYDTTNAPNACYGLWTQYSAGTVFNLNKVTGMEAGVKSHQYNAGLTVTENVIDGANYGVYLDEYNSGDMIAGNFIKNTADEGIRDYLSFNNTYNGNILTSDGSASAGPSYDIESDGYGPVTMVNNYARVGHGYGFYVSDAYSAKVSGPPYSSFVGNNAIANGSNFDPGFYFEYNVGATYSQNSAYANAADGFFFEQPWRAIVTGNMSKMNGNNGFTFSDVYADTQPLAVANNSATYNGGFGFSGYDNYDLANGDSYPVSGSGNTGGGTNASGDCYLVAGCS